MKYIQNTNYINDTIAAIATPFGEGAISVIRISGKNAIKIANKIFNGPVHTYKSHSINYGKILNQNDEIIDSVLLLIMLSPKTYTGEDTIEINCHGGALVTQKVYQRILEAGARAAYPGEFTFRAFLNKKIDLAQAEAVQQLIAAKNETSLKAAKNQLEGSLSLTLSNLQNNLIDISSHIEAQIDFPEEDLEHINKEDIKSKFKKVEKQLSCLLKTYDEGKISTEGVSLAIIGKPNVGKSSLMNLLCQTQKSIVTPFAGTTRDVLEEHIIIGSLHYKLIDTAGIRKTTKAIETEGIKKAKKVLANADIVLLVLDSSRKLDTNDLNLLNSIKEKKTIIVWNKIDLTSPPKKLKHKYTVFISAKEQIGIEKLKQTIETLVWEKVPPSKEEIIITKQRHKEALLSAKEFCQKAIEGLNKNIPLEFIASDTHFCLDSISKIIGKNLTEDVLSSIFSKFCIGK